nr:MAG TPA: protein of unknown function (DUF5383) [Caudoviricetes sp.]
MQTGYGLLVAIMPVLLVYIIPRMVKHGLRAILQVGIVLEFTTQMGYGLSAAHIRVN